MRIRLFKLIFFIATLSVALLNSAQGQTYLISSGGTINTCAGNFYDSGNSTGNYGNNQNFTQTFCPSTAGQCMAFNFSQLNLKNNDVLTIYDGPNTGSPVIYTCNGCNVTGTIISTTGCITFTFTSNNSGVDPGWAAAISCVPCPIFHTSGGNTTTCSGTFYDPGGLGNYPNNFNGLHTICPSTPGQYVSINFSSFNLENGYDFLLIFDGNNGSAAQLGPYTGTTSPGTVTASNSTGCLSFRFISDDIISSSGWSAIVSCTPTPAASPGNSPQDCGGGGGTTICSNASFSGNSSGGGATELFPAWDGCLGGENQSSWYYFSPATSGTIAFDIIPQNGTDDYDFAIWGPYSSVQCPSFTGNSPIRCSWAAGSGNTGLGNGAVDVSEGEFGDGWVAPLNVTAGEVYVMVIDNYSASMSPFDLNWNLSGGASLDCVPLPVELLSYYGEEISGGHLLRWSTASEVNNSHFILEHSSDGKFFKTIAQISGAGNSNRLIEYDFLYTNPSVGKNYYRLNQFNFNGDSKSYGPILIDSYQKGIEIASLQPNPSIDGFSYSLSFDGKEKEVQVELVSLTGKTLFSEVLVAQNGSLYQFDWKNFSAGTYLFKVTDHETGLRAVKKVIRKDY